jgi:Domain of unknown function (DUF4440)
MSLEQNLTKLNIDIGKAEKVRDRAMLDHILANDLTFRRASGVVVDKATYLKDLENPENTYKYLCSEILDVKLSASQDTAIVTLQVRAKGKRAENPFEGVYRNIRFFRKEGQDWKCYAWFNEPIESLSKNDAYTLYEAGKKRRYDLLFAVNGGAFAIAKLLTTSDNKLQVNADYKIIGDLSLAHLAIGMGIFTILMVWDIYAFGEKMRDRHLREEVFGAEGKAVLLLLGFSIVYGWYLVAPNAQITKPNQIIALFFPICFLAIFRWFTRRK